MGKFIHIGSTKFPILLGEEDELINENLYGKALVQYLQAKLIERGYDAPFYCCEDWGWWLELKTAPFAFGVCVYCRLQGGVPMEYACRDNSDGQKKWSWSRFRFVDPSPWANKLHEDLMAIFQADKDVLIVDVSGDFPI